MLPGKNIYVCSNFAIVNKLTRRTVVPQLIYQVDNVDVFHLPDQRYQIPIAHVGLQISSPLIKSIRHVNIFSIFSMMVKDFLSQDISMMKFAGYSLDLHACNNGLCLRLDGFSENILVILSKVVTAIYSIEEVFDKSRFECYKKLLKKNCHNFVVNPSSLLEDLRLHIVDHDYKFFLNRFKDVDGINFYEVKFLLSEIVKTFSVKLFVGGNVSEETVKLFAENIPKTERIPYCYCSENSIRQIPTGSNYLRLRSMMVGNRTSFLENFYQIGINSIENYCVLELLERAMREPLFNSLRTKQQIGYSVHCVRKMDANSVGLVINVKFAEDRFSPAQVDERIESFLLEFLDYLDDLSEHEFNAIRKSAASEKLKCFRKMETEFEFYWSEIQHDTFSYDRTMVQAKQIETIQKCDLIYFFSHHFLGDKRRKLSIQIVPHDDRDYNSLLQQGYLHLDFVEMEMGKSQIKNLPNFISSLPTMMQDC